MISIISNKINDKKRVTVDEATWLYNHATNDQLSMLATTVKCRFHQQDAATHLIMAIVNYTNVCIAKCDYCAFYRLPGEEGAYLNDFETVCRKIDELLGHGGTLLSFNGGFHPNLRLDDYAKLFSAIHARYPGIAFYELTVAEFMFLCKVSKKSYAEGAAQLATAGTAWVTGGGAEVLEEGFRKRHSPLKYTVEDYYTAQQAILDAGMGSTATMTIGFDETLTERLSHLDRLRKFQDDTDGGLTSFLCWTFKPDNTPIGGEEISTDAYLRWIAICRIFLDNFTHIRASVLTQNNNAMRALTMGADDFDLPTEDEVTQSAGATISHDFGHILDHARDLGLNPKRRAPFSDANQRKR